MKQLLFAFFLFSTLSALSQDCSSYQSGSFYVYPKDGGHAVLMERDGDIEKETDLVTGDISSWKIAWKRDCVYTLQYLSGKLSSDEMTKILKMHKLAFKVDSDGKDYYTYSAYMDKVGSVFLETDTVWLHSKDVGERKPVFTYYNGSNDSLFISDTSSYALLYIYRPSNFIGSLLNFEVVINGSAACIVSNNSAFAFFIRKEGPLALATNVVSDKRTDTLSMDIKFGRKYFVRDVAGPVVIAFNHDMRPVFHVETDSTGSVDIEKMVAHKK
jgi:hypothetical protein